jgi:hypothetical protein
MPCMKQAVIYDESIKAFFSHLLFHYGGLILPTVCFVWVCLQGYS